MQKTWIQSLGQEDSPGEGNAKPLQYSHLGNPMDKGAWLTTVHRFAKSQTQLSDCNNKAERKEPATAEGNGWLTLLQISER